MRLAERSLLAADAALIAGMHEAAGFHAYHSLESLAAATVASAGRAVPRAHASKLNTFIAVVGRTPALAPHALQAAALVTRLQSLRNEFLYPIDAGAGVILAPDEVYTAVDVTGIVADVRALTNILVPLV